MDARQRRPVYVVFLPGAPAFLALLLQYYWYHSRTFFLPRGNVRPADKLQFKAATKLPFVGPARSKQYPINRGHGAQYFYVAVVYFDVVQDFLKSVGYASRSSR